MADKNILIKPVSGSCNMRCRYCFYIDETRNRETACFGAMSTEVLEQVIKKTIEASDRDCTIGYQGGEPTLRGLEFFRKSIEFQKQYNTKHIRIHNSIQTNGYDLSDEWIEFLKENKFLVGISLDGTAFTHDRFRVDVSGEPTHQRVLDTIHRLEKAGVPYNILTVVHAVTARKISSIYQFYKEQNFPYLQFIPCLNPLGKEKERYEYTLTPEQYGHFLKTLFDLWFRDLQEGRMIHIQQFENYVYMMRGCLPAMCGMGGVCSMQNVIEADGEVYPCDFYALDQYKLGNLAETSFEEIDQKRMETGFIQQSLFVPEECRACRYQKLCRNGCRRHRIQDTAGNWTRNYFCRAYYEFFEYSWDRLTLCANRVRL